MNWDEYHQTRYVFEPRRSLVWQQVCQWLQREIPAAGTVLELGAGSCDFINQIGAHRKLALDIAPVVTQSAGPGVEPHVGSCSDLSFLAADSVDAVFASNLIEHLTLDQIRTTLAECRRVLRPTGKLILVQPNFRDSYRTYFDDYTHVSIFTERSLADVVTAAGFQVTRAQRKFLPFSMKSRLPAWGPLVWLYLRSPWKPNAGQMLLVAQKSGSASRIS